MKQRILQLAAALVLTGGSLERTPAETVGGIVLPPDAALIHSPLWLS